MRALYHAGPEIAAIALHYFEREIQSADAGLHKAAQTPIL